MTCILKTKCFKFWNKHYTIFLYVLTGTCITKYVLILIILWVLLNTAGYSWGYIHVFDQSTKSLYWISSDCITNIAKREIITKKRHVWIWHNPFTTWYWNIRSKAQNKERNWVNTSFRIHHLIIWIHTSVNNDNLECEHRWLPGSYIQNTKLLTFIVSNKNLLDVKKKHEKCS